MSLTPRSSPLNPSRGSSLIEVLVVITLLGLISIPVMITLSRLNHKHRLLSVATQANLITQRNLEVASNLIQTSSNWDTDSIPHPDQPTKYSPPTAPNWKFAPISTPVTIEGRYQTHLTFQPVCRNAQNHLVPFTPGCSPDPLATEVISTTAWLEGQLTKSVSMTTIFTQIKTLP